MRIRLTFLFAVLVFSVKLGAQAPHRHWRTGDGHSIICYYSTVPVERFIPPPDSYTSRLKSGQAAGATFQFTIENPPNQDAFDVAEMVGEIWGSIIYSPVPINVKIVFGDQGVGTLASTGTPWPPRIIDDNGYLPMRRYVQALAEKFYGINLNGDNPDMTMTFNSGVSWYFGLDGNPPSTKYDFLSTLLHEVAHGLGYFGFFTVDEDEIGYGLQIPYAFDGFLENDEEERLSDTLIFPVVSEKLGNALTTPPIYYASPIVAVELPDEATPPKMYTPYPWRSGNSLYHLDQIYDFKNGGRDALMTYSTSPGEAIHDPGPLTTYMLYEQGWVHTFIRHDTLKDREDLLEPFTVKARIYGDEGIKTGTQHLYYSFNGFQTSQSTAMSPTGNPDEFSADIPVPSLNTTVNYYIETKDTYDRIYTMPAVAPENYYRFFVGPDNTAPVIEHRPVKHIFDSQKSLAVRAEINDNLGLAVTQVEYKINGADQEAFDLVHDTLSDYQGYFVFGEGNISAGDVIDYRIKAIDGSISGHTTYHPASGYHEFQVFDLLPTTDNYTNDFESGLGDFVPGDFYHDKPAGWGSYGMHTEHPYPAWNREDTQLELEEILRVPIRLNPGNSQMIFDEIVYVEDGEADSKFGDWNFWDYVIVEGSKDTGQTWQPLIDGYDVREKPVWSNKFTQLQYQDYIRNLTTAVPSESDMRSHVIDLLATDYFNDNEVILIRFRLFSDPFWSGWGWAIDNLEIGPSVYAGDYPMSPEAIDIYPNPATNFLNVRMQMNREMEDLEIGLTDLVGKELFVVSYDNPGSSFSRHFDLSGLPNGVYFMKFSSGGQSLIKKVILAR